MSRPMTLKEEVAKAIFMRPVGRCVRWEDVGPGNSLKKRSMADANAALSVITKRLREDKWEMAHEISKRCHVSSDDSKCFLRALAANIEGGNA